MQRVFEEEQASEFNDSIKVKEDVLAGSHAITAIAINNTYLTASMIYALTVNQTVRFVCKIGEKYLAANQTVVGGMASQRQVQTLSTFDAPAALISKAYVELLQEIKSERDEELAEVEKLVKRRPSISRAPIMCTVEEAIRAKRSIRTPTNMSTLSEKIGPRASDPIEQMQSILKKNTFADFTELSKQATDTYIILKDKATVRLAKCYSLSCGNHDRYHSSKLRDPSAYLDMDYLSSMCDHVFSDMTPPAIEAIHENDIEAINKAIFDFRSTNMVEFLKNAKCNVTGKNPRLYVHAKEVSYYRAGRNGRPDLILLNSKGQVVGVVEIKRVSKATFEDNKSTYLKQIANLHQMFQAVESYLVIMNKNDPRRRITLLTPSDILLKQVDISLPIALNNFAALRSAILAVC